MRSSFFLIELNDGGWQAFTGEPIGELLFHKEVMKELQAETYLIHVSC